MKTYRLQWILALVLGASAHARQPNNRDDRRPPLMQPGPPLFAILDTNRDGALSDDEIKAAADLLAKLDKNGDGKITLEEFRMPPPPPKDGESPKGPPPEGQKRPVPPLIHALDADHDGTISAKEMEDAPESLKALDKNSDGELSPDELRPPGPPPVEDDGPKGPPPEGDGGGVE